MKIIILSALFLISNVQKSFAGGPLIVNWNSFDGKNRFQSSSYKNDFYQLANFYQPQINPLYCSSATATIILNALNYGKIKSQKSREVKVPDSNEIISYNLYTQDSFFNELTDKIKDQKIIDYQEPLKISEENIIYDPGLDLNHFADILTSVYKLKVAKYHVTEVDHKTVRHFRKQIMQILREDKQFIVANFYGKSFGQETGGHISPIVAYDSLRDSVLILDVALHKNPWYWVPLETIYKSMNTMDGENYRGYLIISK